MTTYRGQPIEYAIYNRKAADTYTLIDSDGYSLTEMSVREFLSFPNRQNIEVRNGRHRTAGSKDQRGSAGKSGGTGGIDPFDSPWITNLGTVTNSKQGSGPGLTLKTMADMLALMPPGLLLPSSHWRSLQLDEIKPALKRDGVVAGEIVGYRCWRVEKGFLRSVYQSDIWKPGEVLEGRELGDWDQRGIHAWKDPGSKQYHDYIRGYLNRESSDPFRRSLYFGSGDTEPVDRPAMVTGTVFLWGDVVEHERGWRAEYARVRSLDWLYPDETMMGRERAALDALRRRYSFPSQVSKAVENAGD